MTVRTERVLYGMGPQPVRQIVDPLITPGCGDGQHCTAHGNGPFHCCRCGAQFLLLDWPRCEEVDPVMDKRCLASADHSGSHVYEGPAELAKLLRYPPRR